MIYTSRGRDVVVIRRVAMMLAVMALLSGCFASEWWRLERQLKSMPNAQAFAAFRKLPPREQAGLYVWQLEHSRPPASPYEFLLKENGGQVSPILLKEAVGTDNFFVSASVLGTLSSFSKEAVSNLNPIDLQQALENCKVLAGNRSEPLCLDPEEKLNRVHASPK